MISLPITTQNIHKFTWSARGSRSIIDYIIVNRKLEGQVRDTRVYRGQDIRSDHFLVVALIDTYTKWKKRNKLTSQQKFEQVYKVHLLNDPSI